MPAFWVRNPGMLLTGHPFVSRLKQLVRLGVPELASFEAIVERELAVRKRDELVVLGTAFRNMCFVRDGSAIRYRLLRSGKRQILNVIIPGDVIGFPLTFLDR